MPASVMAQPIGPVLAHSLQGRLEDLSLPDIMQVVQSMAKTGALLLERADGGRATCVFKNGRLVQAATDEGYETLGDRLIRKRIISRANLDEALRYLAQFPGMRVGDALAEKGFASRPVIEAQCSAHLIETVRRLMEWRDGIFEFRVGQVSMVSELPSLEMDFVLDNGVEPVQVLLRASVLQDEGGRTTRGTEPSADAGAEPVADDVARAIGSFEAAGGPDLRGDQDDPEAWPPMQKLLRVSEELHTALTPSETRLLLLRFASQVYAHGALLNRTGDRFTLVGAFGKGLPLASRDARKGSDASPESSLLDVVVATRRPYLGNAFVTDEGRLVAAPQRTPGTFSVLCVPLILLGEVRLVLGCRQLIGGAQDVRALIAVARQAGVMFENIVLKRRAATGRPGPARDRS